MTANAPIYNANKNMKLLKSWKRSLCTNRFGNSN